MKIALALLVLVVAGRAWALGGVLINPFWTVHGMSPIPIPVPDGDHCFQVRVDPMEPRPSGLCARR